MSRHWKLPATLWAALSMLATSALSQTFDVKELSVKEGTLELGLDNTVHAGVARRDDNRSGHDQSLDYGVAKWWRLSAVMKLENPLNDELRLARASVENLWVLRELPQAGGFGLGWFTSLEVSTDQATANASQFGPIIMLRQGKLSLAANPFLEQTFGRNRTEGIALNYGWNAKYRFNQNLAIGIEGFGLIENLGNSPALADQEHRFGPAIFASIQLREDLTITPDLGVFFGLTEATPKLTLKFNVGIPLSQPRASTSQ
jgi:hypothetical protein